MPSFDYDQSLNDNEIIETVYNPRASIGDIVKSWFLKDLGEKWRNYKCSLKQKFFDEAFTPQYVKNNAPTDVNLEQFCKLVDFWYSDAGRHRSHAGKQNRSLQTTVHTAGSKSFARYAHELEKEKQVPIIEHPAFLPVLRMGYINFEQRQYQDVANNNHVSPAIHRSSHASRKTSVDNVDDAESAGADGAEGGED
ncbi:hypothetical protein CJ030_MR1G023830 [Morella rubra]|uniref:Uncharacterized protein n=1 Tax=Morella rubra TaxID=262757 RepID=A0A6A1WQJ1_9ROSI|nr:hypothetical protein CJ030_MR1G023830 [Morella rubra]